jgi:hypothetical protein
MSSVAKALANKSKMYLFEFKPPSRKAWCHKQIYFQSIITQNTQRMMNQQMHCDELPHKPQLPKLQYKSFHIIVSNSSSIPIEAWA